MIGKRTPVGVAVFIGLALAAASSARSSTMREGMEALPHAAAPRASDRVRLVLASTGNEARYRVREQLAGVDFPNDAVGATSEITGGIVIGSDGKVVREESRFVVDLRKLKSDRDRRDQYIQRRTLETEQFPTVELIPTALRDLPLPLPTSGSRTFAMLGDLTVRGVTRPTTWQVRADFGNGRITGSASTAFTFEEFGLTKPRVASVLSVADSIHLEYDFNLVPSAPAQP